MATWRPFESTAALQEAAEDGPHNLLNGKPFSAGYRDKLRTRRDALPVSRKRDEILDAYHHNDIVIICGETGSGKTTQIPQIALLDTTPDELRQRRRQVCCTQPRVWACEGVAARVAAEMDVKLGNEIGYRHGSAIKAHSQTALVFQTDGYLMNIAKNDPLFNKYSCIIIDEAHERTADTDLLMGLLKEASADRRARNDPLKLIIMSATLNLDVFTRYFPGNNNVVHIPGFTHGVEVNYLAYPRGDPVEIVSEVVIDNIHDNQPSGDVLVFVPGQADIKRVITKIGEYAKRRQIGPELKCIAASARMTPEEQDEIYDRPPLSPDGRLGRKVIVSTNVAETSLTIPGLKYVVDTGRIKISAYDPILDMDYLVSGPISKANARQRKGRVGREEPGVVFRLYTEEEYVTQFADQPPAQMVRDSVMDAVLKLLALNRDPFTFDYLVPPPNSGLVRALDQLRWMGFIHEDGKSLTKSGGHVASIPLPLHQAAALFGGTSKGSNCTTELCAIFAMIQASSSRDVWLPKPNNSTDAGKWERARNTMRHWSGDHLTLLYLFNHFMHAKDRYKGGGELKKWCDQNFLHLNTLRIAEQTYNKLLVTVADRAFWSVSSLKYDDPLWATKILRALCKGYFMRSAMCLVGDAYRRPEHGYVTKLNDKSPGLSGGVDDCKWVIFDSICQGQTKVLLNTVTAVPPDILISMCPAYFRPSRFPDRSESTYKDKDHPKDVLSQRLARLIGQPTSKLNGPRLEQLDRQAD